MIDADVALLLDYLGADAAYADAVEAASDAYEDAVFAADEAYFDAVDAAYAAYEEAESAAHNRLDAELDNANSAYQNAAFAAGDVMNAAYEAANTEFNAAQAAAAAARDDAYAAAEPLDDRYRDALTAADAAYDRAVDAAYEALWRAESVAWDAYAAADRVAAAERRDAEDEAYGRFDEATGKASATHAAAVAAAETTWEDAEREVWLQYVDQLTDATVAWGQSVIDAEKGHADARIEAAAARWIGVLGGGFGPSGSGAGGSASESLAGNFSLPPETLGLVVANDGSGQISPTGGTILNPDGSFIPIAPGGAFPDVVQAGAIFVPHGAAPRVGRGLENHLPAGAERERAAIEQAKQEAEAALRRKEAAVERGIVEGIAQSGGEGRSYEERIDAIAKLRVYGTKLSRKRADELHDALADDEADRIVAEGKAGQGDWDGVRWTAYQTVNNDAHARYHALKGEVENIGRSAVTAAGLGTKAAPAVAGGVVGGLMAPRPAAVTPSTAVGPRAPVSRAPAALGPGRLSRGNVDIDGVEHYKWIAPDGRRYDIQLDSELKDGTLVIKEAHLVPEGWAGEPVDIGVPALRALLRDLGDYFGAERASLPKLKRITGAPNKLSFGPREFPTGR